MQTLCVHLERSLFYSFTNSRTKQAQKYAVCGMKNIDLTKDAVKIIGIGFSYNKAIQNELNFRTTISKIQAVLKLWRM